MLLALTLVFKFVNDLEFGLAFRALELLGLLLLKEVLRIDEFDVFTTFSRGCGRCRVDLRTAVNFPLVFFIIKNGCYYLDF